MRHNKYNLLKKLLWKMQHEKSKWVDINRISVFDRPEGATDFYRFDDYLAKKTNTRLEPLHLLRLHEIDAMLRKYGVKSVCEMGSGRTTYFFNSYAGLDVMSYEQDEKWRDILFEFYDESGRSRPKIECCNVEHYKNGGRFVSFQGGKYDLLYIDGPYVTRTTDKFATYTGKPAYFDFERILEAGLPKVIMIEGRTDTVDEILSSRYAADYNFRGELTWALERNKFLHALRLGRHSIFVRKE